MYKFLQAGVIRPFAWLFFGARLVGQNRIPRHGAAIVVANHLAAGETVILPALIHRRVAFLAKAELFAGNKGFISRVLAWFMKTIEMVPVQRAGGKDALQALSKAIDALDEGKIIAIFPEGTRSPDGYLYKGKTGAARLAVATGAPVIPVGLTNTPAKKILGGIRWYWRPLATVGEPIHFDKYLGRTHDLDVLRYVTDEIMAAIQDITGQEYIDVYASSVKHGTVTPEEAQKRLLPRPGFGRSTPGIIEPAIDTPAVATTDQTDSAAPDGGLP